MPHHSIEYQLVEQQLAFGLFAELRQQPPYLSRIGDMLLPRLLSGQSMSVYPSGQLI